MGMLLTRPLVVLRTLSSCYSGIALPLVGLDAAGKTTLLYRLKLDEFVTTIPTIGFNVETVTYQNLQFTVWDIGGQSRIRGLWSHYYQNTQAVIFVCDSSDRERLPEAANELKNIFEDPEMPAKHLLVFANKQDLNGALRPSEIAEQLQLSSLRNINWHVQSSCAIRADGIFEGLQWLSRQIKS